MNEPIAVKDALTLLSMALADCDKATGREWPEYEPEEDGPEIADFVQFAYIARATMRPLLEYLSGKVASNQSEEQEIVFGWDHEYLSIAALRDHYDAVRSDWRTR